MAKQGKVKCCEVCKEPETHGPHKHRYEYCKICKKRTVHVVAFFGLPWHCSESHFKKGKCSKCGKKLPKEAIELAKALGASNVICPECSKPAH